MSQNDEEKKLPKLDVGPMRVVGRSAAGKSRQAWDACGWLKQKTGGARGGGKGNGFSTITVQAVICGLIVVGILCVKALNIPQSTEALANFNTVLTSDSDIDKALGKLKFVGSFFGNSEPVFNPEEQGLTPPIAGMAIETGGGPQYMLNVDVGDEVTPVLASADGQVFYSGASNEYGTLIRIRHQEGYETYYAGLTPEVKTGRTVLAGERIGVIKNGTLKFIVFHDGAAIDPREYLSKGNG